MRGGRGAGGRHVGGAVQVDPIKPTLKPPGTKRLTLKCDILLSTSAFTSNLHHYTSGRSLKEAIRMVVERIVVGRCRLTL